MVIKQLRFVAVKRLKERLVILIHQHDRLLPRLLVSGLKDARHPIPISLLTPLKEGDMILRFKPRKHCVRTRIKSIRGRVSSLTKIDEKDWVLYPRLTPLLTRELFLGVLEIKPLKQLLLPLKIGCECRKEKALPETARTAKEEILRVFD